MTLKEQRAKKGLSQSQLAEASGVSKRTIQHYESGFRDLDLAKLGTLSKLALALDCRIADLLNSSELKKIYNQVK